MEIQKRFDFEHSEISTLLSLPTSETNLVGQSRHEQKGGKDYYFCMSHLVLNTRILTLKQEKKKSLKNKNKNLFKTKKETKQALQNLKYLLLF